MGRASAGKGSKMKCLMMSMVHRLAYMAAGT